MGAHDRSRDLLASTEQLNGAGGREYDPTTDEFRITDDVGRIHDRATNSPPTLDEMIDGYLPEDRSRLQTAIDEAASAGEAFDLPLRLIGEADDHR